MTFKQASEAGISPRTLSYLKKGFRHNEPVRMKRRTKKRLIGYLTRTNNRKTSKRKAPQQNVDERKRSAN